MFVFWVLQ